MESNNELKIELYPENKPKSNFKLESLKKITDEKTIVHSFDINNQLAYIDSNVPVLQGFYGAHCYHYPIKIKPDDIWLLIVQAFNNHVNSNSELLRKMFVNFDNKKQLNIDMGNKEITKETMEEFIEKVNIKMKEFLGEEISDILTPNFTTTDFNSKIVCKISIIGVFKEYFKPTCMQCICGIPYIILEGIAEDYKKIIEKSKFLSKYKFEWYINRILPHIQKMVDAKEGKIDNDYFKNIIQKKEITEKRRNACFGEIEVKLDCISGWFLNFFGYTNYRRPFEENSIKVEELGRLANQILIVPFTINELGKEYNMEFKVGFIGCDQNDKKEVYPVVGWLASKVGKVDVDVNDIFYKFFGEHYY